MPLYFTFNQQLSVTYNGIIEHTFQAKQLTYSIVSNKIKWPFSRFITSTE